MKHSVLLLMLLAPLSAHASQSLAQQKNCMSCHAVERKVVGPSFQDIAKRYGGKGAEAQLEQKIVKGSAGAWGPVPMPPSNISPADAKALTQWILQQG